MDNQGWITVRRLNEAPAQTRKPKTAQKAARKDKGAGIGPTKTKRKTAAKAKPKPKAAPKRQKKLVKVDWNN